MIGSKTISPRKTSSKSVTVRVTNASNPTVSGIAGQSAPGANPILLDPIEQTERVDLRVLSAMRRIIRRVDLYSKVLAAKAQITSPQLVCLLMLAEKGAMTATTLSRQVFLSPSTIVGIIDRLEEKGLVTRARATIDRRVVAVTITDEGLRVAQSAPSPLQDTLAEALRALPHHEQVEIAGSLERVVSLMEAQNVDAPPSLEPDSLTKPASAPDV
jgi:DNA-binding MarR family transcriptional regulator